MTWGWISSNETQTALHWLQVYFKLNWEKKQATETHTQSAQALTQFPNHQVLEVIIFARTLPDTQLIQLPLSNYCLPAPTQYAHGQPLMSMSLNTAFLSPIKFTPWQTFTTDTRSLNKDSLSLSLSGYHNKSITPHLSSRVSHARSRVDPHLHLHCLLCEPLRSLTLFFFL